MVNLIQLKFNFLNLEDINFLIHENTKQLMTLWGISYYDAKYYVEKVMERFTKEAKINNVIDDQIISVFRGRNDRKALKEANRHHRLMKPLAYA